MKAAGYPYFTKLSTTPPVTTDIPASSSSPLEISLQGEMVSTVNIRIDTDCYWTIADTAASGLSRIGSDGTRGKIAPGWYNFDCSGNHAQNLYIRSQASASASGISYSYSEFS